MNSTEAEFPCSIVIDIPLPTQRLATFALRTLQVDAELSPLVRRTFHLTSSKASAVESTIQEALVRDQDRNVLRTEYRATTNRRLRVAVNGFMESLGVVLQVMQELDVDVLESGPKA